MSASKDDDDWDPYKLDKEVGKRMQVAVKRFQLTCKDEFVPPDEKQQIKDSLMSTIKDNDMAPLYVDMSKQFGWALDQALLDGMSAVRKQKLEELEKKYSEAVEGEGENEIYDAALEKADYLAKGWDRVAMVKALEFAAEKAISTGQKIDVMLHVIRNCFMHMDLSLCKEYLDKAEKLVTKGGDWDRRNRLRVYTATYCMCKREMKKAAELFLESVATFTCYDLMPYNDCIFYTVITSLLSLDRVVLREKVVTNPEILTVLNNIPNLGQFMNSLYNCEYKQYFEAMVEIWPMMMRDRFLASHTGFAIREFRIKGYSQLLQSYKSVTLESMAGSFGVSVEFLDKELSRFIASRRLSAKIDKVNAIVETQRPDAKNAQYQAVLKHGDTLLNRVQRLARMVSV